MAKFMKVRKKEPELYAEDCSKCIPYGAYFSSTGNIVLDDGMGRALILKPDSIVLTDESEPEKTTRFLINKEEFEEQYEVVEDYPE